MKYGEVLIRKDANKDTQREGGHVTRKAEIGVTHLQGKERQGLPANTRS